MKMSNFGILSCHTSVLVCLVMLHIDLDWIILYIITRSWDKIRVSADRTKIINLSYFSWQWGGAPPKVFHFS